MRHSGSRPARMVRRLATMTTLVAAAAVLAGLVVAPHGWVGHGGSAVLGFLAAEGSGSGGDTPDGDGSGSGADGSGPGNLWGDGSGGWWGDGWWGDRVGGASSQPGGGWWGAAGVSGDGSGVSGNAAGPGACRYPSQVLDVRRWKLTLPTGSAGKPKEITPPALTTFTSSPWFQPTDDCSGVVFRAAVSGVTTKGSSYPRSELREMTEDGSNASWSSTEGTHTLTVTEAFTRLPRGKPELVGAQIHGESDDITVFRLEGSNLYITNGDNPHYKLVSNNYVLGTRFEAKYVVSGGVVTAYYNGQPRATLTKSFANAYFKAGAYTQANCAKAAPCSADNYGETVIYQLQVSHQ